MATTTEITPTTTPDVAPAPQQPPTPEPAKEEVKTSPAPTTLTSDNARKAYYESQEYLKGVTGSVNAKNLAQSGVQGTLQQLGAAPGTTVEQANKLVADKIQQMLAEPKTEQPATTETTATGTTETSTEPTKTTTTTATPAPLTPEQEAEKKNVADKEAALNLANQAVSTEIENVTKILNNAASLETDPALVDKIKGINDRYDKMVKEMQVFNKNRVQGLELIGIRAGRQRYASEIQSGIIGAEEAAGMERITNLNNERGKLVSEAKDAFRQNKIQEGVQKINLLKENSLMKEKELTRLEAAIDKREAQLYKEKIDQQNYDLNVRQYNDTQAKDYRSNIVSMIDKAGSGAFKNMTSEQITDLEAKAGYPKGTINSLTLAAKAVEEAKREDELEKYLDKQQDNVRQTVGQYITSGGIKDITDADIKALVKQSGGLYTADTLNAMRQAARDKADAQERKDAAAEARAIAAENRAQKKFDMEEDEWLTSKKGMSESTVVEGVGSVSAAVAALAQDYATTGKMPSAADLKASGVSFADVQNVAKAMPKPDRSLVTRNTNVKPSNLSETQTAGITSLNEIIQDTLPRMSELRKQLVFGGNLLPWTSAERQEYRTLRGEFLSKLLKARSGAAVTEQEYKRLSDLIPEDSDIFNAENKLNSILGSAKKELDNTLNTHQLAITGYSKVKIGGQEYTVGEEIEQNGLTGRVLPDGTVSVEDFNEVGGDTEKAVTQTTPVKSVAISTAFKDGYKGGQCGTFAHKLVEFPPVGDSKSEKIAAVRKHGIPADTWKINPQVGDVIITGENPTYGHVAVVNEVLPDGRIKLSESNFKQSNVVSNDRVISINNPKIYGAIRGNPKFS